MVILQTLTAFNGALYLMIAAKLSQHRYPTWSILSAIALSVWAFLMFIFQVYGAFQSVHMFLAYVFLGTVYFKVQ